MSTIHGGPGGEDSRESVLPIHIKGVGTFYPAGERSKRGVIRGYVDGQQYEVATDAKNKRTARADWNAFAQDIRAECRQPETGLTFNDALAHYRASGDRSMRQIEYLEAVEPRLRDIPIDAIKAGLVRTLAKELYPKATAATRNRCVLGPVGAAINCFADDDYCNHIRIKKFPEVKRAKRPASDKTEQILLANTSGPEHLYLTMIFRQGFRVSETLGVDWDDIDLSKREIVLYVGKARTEKRIPMHRDVFALLANAGEGPLFPWDTRHEVTAWLKPLRKKLGITFSSHRARDKWASDRNEDGFTDHDMVAAGSWTDTRALKDYVDVDKDHARSVVERDRKQGEG